MLISNTDNGWNSQEISSCIVAFKHNSHQIIPRDRGVEGIPRAVFLGVTYWVILRMINRFLKIPRAFQEIFSGILRGVLGIFCGVGSGGFCGASHGGGWWCRWC